MHPGQNVINPVPPQVPVIMPAPYRPPNCPTGLEYLTQIDQLLIHQNVHIAEIVLNLETRNSYTVKNSVGQQVFAVAEENDCCTLMFCGPGRPFTLHLKDNLGQEVVTVTRPLRCSLCCFPCCLQELEVQSPPGCPIGYIIQECHVYLPKFIILNERREPQLRIQGPLMACSWWGDINFEVKSLDESVVVGQISKQWSGFIQEAFTDTDNFGISFPMDLDVKVKASLLGACFLIDFMFFEKQKGSNG
ncbi:phospholipid scramblase 2-like [Osmerus eperlanus]|uniref:phospholipid scramblase 2-like n=1 Tax=Osmerus eperlanus TaxID=29151 RepID=UPI002E0E9D47